MFARSLDGKKIYTLEDGTVAVDLTESIFDKNKMNPQIYSLYKVSRGYEMRPDLVSQTLYGSTDYAEMILKLSLINNPFSIEYDDIIYGSSLSQIYNNVKTTSLDKTGAFDAL